MLQARYVSQVSVEHENNYRLNCVQSQTLAGEAKRKAGIDTYFTLCSEIEIYRLILKINH